MSDKPLYLALVVLLAVFAGLFALGNWSDSGPLGWDGYIAEPGCDWGNPNCEPEDYRVMCASYEGGVRDAVYVRYCRRGGRR